MARGRKPSKPLTASRVKALTAPGNYADGGGLYLQITTDETGEHTRKSWLFRYSRPGDGKRCWMGLGPADEVSLADARREVAELRTRVRAGHDPVAERQQRRREAAEAVAKRVTFRVAAGRYIEAHAPEWKNAKHQQQWRNTLRDYAFPVIGGRLVGELDAADVLKVLEPRWLDRHETMRRVRARIERVLAWCMVHGYRDASAGNPAALETQRELLPKLTKTSEHRKVRHHPAIPYRELPEFMARLRERKGMAARALEFLTLTATRTSEVRGATWGEIDLTAGLWRIPASRMKAGVAHTVPLSDAATKVLEAIRPERVRDDDPVFIAPRGGQLSNMAMLQSMRKMGSDKTPHGMRSAFRTWCAERRPDVPDAVAEACLAHTVKDDVVKAYRRTRFDRLRLELFDTWAQFLDGDAAHPGESVEPEPAANVQVLRPRR
ncbi:MAG: tyrosine-type recombinase/integrase [Pseudomonadota bacterium]